MVQLLTMGDFIGKKLWSGSTLDILSQVACVAREKLLRRKKKMENVQPHMDGGSSNTPKTKRSREDDVDDHDKGSRLKQQKITEEPNSSVGKELVMPTFYSADTINRQESEPYLRANHTTDCDLGLGFHEKNGVRKKKKGRKDDKDLSLKPKRKSMKSKKAKRVGTKMPRKEHMIRTPRYSTDPNDLPEELKRKIETLEGIESFEKAKMTMVIEKSLYSTDLTATASRLSMPLKQTKPESFLDEEEIRFLASQNDWPVVVITPKLEEKGLTLRQWNMNKNNGNVSSSYVLKSGWNEVHLNSGLGIFDVIQVWSFRDVGNNLHFAIVLLEKATEGGSGSGSGSGLDSSDGDEGSSRRSSSRSTTSPSNNDTGEKSSSDSSDIGQDSRNRSKRSCGENV